MVEQHEQPEKKPRKQRRRGHGEGTIYKRRDREGYAASITLDDGTRKTYYGKTYQQTQEKLLKARHEQRQGTLITEKDQKVGQYLQYWLESVDKPHVRIGTYVMRRGLLHNHILPAIGHLLLQKLTPGHIQALYTQKLNEGFAPGTIRQMHAVLHKALRNAVRWNKIMRNPCDAVTPPRLSAPEQQALTVDQARQLLEAAKGHRFEVLIALAVVTGMRRGELVGLKWQDIDFEKRTLQVRRTVNRLVGHGFTVSEPKTTSSKRTIVLPSFLVAMLKQHRTNQLAIRLKVGSAWHDHGIVFCNRTGGFMDPTHLGEAFEKLLKDAGLAHIRFHDLRHSAATILLSMGVNPKVVQEVLGHSNISITLGVYGHVLPNMHNEAMGKMENLFGED